MLRVRSSGNKTFKLNKLRLITTFCFDYLLHSKAAKEMQANHNLPSSSAVLFGAGGFWRRPHIQLVLLKASILVAAYIASVVAAHLAGITVITRVFFIDFRSSIRNVNPSI